jgi:hypothetical protein
MANGKRNSAPITTLIHTTDGVEKLCEAMAMKK